MSSTERVKKLRDQMVRIPEVCVERAYYMTESYKTTESKPVVLRRALATENILKKMSVRIEEGELIVGWPTSKIRGGALLVELNSAWILREIDTLADREWEKYQPLSEDEKSRIREFMPYWLGKTMYEKWGEAVPEGAKKLENIVQGGGYARNGHHTAHAVPNYGHVLRLGLGGMTAEVDGLIASLDPCDPEDIPRLHFYEAVKTSHRAVVSFAARYSRLAAELAASETDETRRDELNEISRICAKVPEKPADTLQEALQSIWFVFLGCMVEGWGAGMSLGRLDQYMLPYYESTLASGVTRPQIQELFELLLVKMNAVINLQEGFLSVAFSGYPVMQGLTIGGVTKSGDDAVNDLTYVILDAEENVGLTSEDLVVRISRKNPEKYVMRACEVARNLRGKLKFIGDEVSIQSMLHLGLPIELARDYISTGCHNNMIPSVSHSASGVVFNYALMLELALTNGVLRKTGERIGPMTGDPRTFTDFSQVLDAFEAQFEALARVSFIFKNVDMRLYAENVPCPLLSSFYLGCLKSGRDLYNVGTYPYATHTTGLCGAANVGDGLAAIKKLVFDEKRVSMDELCQALERDFVGFEHVLALINKAPKFGNDSDYVDLLLKDVLSRSCDFLEKHSTYRGRKTNAGAASMTSNIPFGELVGATPDGRRAGEPLAEGGISPHQGRNISGATSTFNSVAKLDLAKLTNGSILNMRMAYDTIKDAESLRKFSRMVRTFFEDGGNLVQFNFTSNKMLRDAQKHPEKYKDLLVRVATYSSYFVELSPTLQENIIARTEFEE